MLKSKFVPIGALGFCAVLSGQQVVNTANCSTMNNPKGPYPYGVVGEQQHSSGAHAFANNMNGNCTYSGQAQVAVQVPCSPHSTANSGSNGSDNGNTAPYWHSASQKDANGVTDGAAGATAVSDAEGAVAINSCPVFPCGGPGITITGSGNGGGFNVAFSGVNVIWGESQHYTNTCAAYALAPLPASSCPYPTGQPPYNPNEGQAWNWNTQTCTWQLEPNNSPVVIDTRNVGFHFTDPTKGNYVSFDIRGDGVLLKVSWPDHTSGNAWLVLDRDGDGVIKSGTELFGNFTPHSDGGVANNPSPNGFLALAWYDQPAQGGDMNLILDKRDAIWGKLRLWVDEHCYLTPDVACQSRPAELHTLESMGVTSISLLWDAKFWMDKVGNQYKVYTVLNPEAETTPRDEKGHACCDLHQKSKDGRVAYDVWLKTVN